MRKREGIEKMARMRGGRDYSGKRKVQRTSVDNLAAVEVGESVQDSFPYLAEHFLSYSSTELLDLAVDAVETSAFAVFHCY